MSMGLPLPETGRRPWGMHLALDLVGCDLATISDRTELARFATALVKHIGMTAYGEPVLERFALDNPDAAGYSLMQLITTSSITGHFSELHRTAYIDVFSCRTFDVQSAVEFITEFFDASGSVARLLNRGSI